MTPNSAVLLAEDDENFVMLIKLAFERAGLANPLHVVRNGAEVIEYLKGEGKFSDRTVSPLPCLLLLDLKLPLQNGFDVLSWMRSTPGLKRLAVVILSSSDEPCDLERAYDLGANSYAVKPSGFEELMEFLKRLQGWWLTVNQSTSLDLDSSGKPGSADSRIL